jgi:hypothetical protein
MSFFIELRLLRAFLACLRVDIAFGAVIVVFGLVWRCACMRWHNRTVSADGASDVNRALREGGGKKREAGDDE